MYVVLEIEPGHSVCSVNTLPNELQPLNFFLIKENLTKKKI